MGPTIRRYANLLLWVAVVGHLVGVVAVLLALLVFGEHTRPTFFLLYLPRQPYAAVSILLLPLAVFSRKRALVAAEIVATLIALFPLMGLRVAFPAKPHGTRLRLLTYNVFYAKLDRAALTREIVGAGADVVVLQAGRSSYAVELQAQLPGWTVRADDEFVLATKLKIRSAEVPERFENNVLAGWARYTLEGPTGPFQIVDVHPVSARAGLFDREDPRTATEVRTNQIASAVAAASHGTEPVIIAGDTNLPPLSAIGRQYFSGFRDAFDEVGRGFGYTFPAKIPWMRLDRVLAGKGIRFLDLHVLPRGASDHLAVTVDFELATP